MAIGKCIFCGAKNELSENDFSTCNECGLQFLNSKAVDFNNVPDEHTSRILEIRANLKKAVIEEDKYLIQSFSNEIRDFIPDDFKARYYYAYAKKVDENQYFLNKFIYDANRKDVTQEEINEVINHLIAHCTPKDEKKIVEFIKKMAIDLNEEKVWRDCLDEAKDRLELEKASVPFVYVCYDMEDYKTSKKVIDAINLSEFKVINNDEDPSKIDSCKVFVIITSANSMKSNIVKNKMIKASNQSKPIIEFKIDEMKHSAIFNDYLGDDEYIIGYDNIENSLQELIQAISDEIFVIDEESKTLKLNLRKESNKARIEQKEKDAKRREQEEKEKEIRRISEETRLYEERAMKARLEAERIAKEKEEADRLDRMEKMILDAYTPSKMIKSETVKSADIDKMMNKVEKLIEAGEDLIALDMCDDLILKYPGDYRVWFLYVKLETSNFTNLNDTSHIRYMDRALELAPSIQKQQILKEYLPYSNLKEKIHVFRNLAVCLNTRVVNVPKGIHLCNDGIRAYRDGNIKEAIKYWILGSQKGNSEAQYCLAVQYISGRYIEQNVSKAMGLFIKAAKQDHEKSIMTLADAYEKGLFGIEKDPEASIYYYKKISGKGNKDIINNMMKLGETYEISGYKIPANKAIALKYFEAAAEEGDLNAILKCASLHCYGIGGMYDKAKGADYYKKGAELGLEYAMVRYAEISKKGLYDKPKDEETYVDLITKLAHGYPENEEYQNEYISIYENGTYGVKKDLPAVVNYYEDLCRVAPNVINYQLKLAEIYERGLYGAKIDTSRVISLYYNAASKHPENEACQIKMAEIYEKGLYGVVKNISIVGQIYAYLAKHYPENPRYLVKLAELFKISSGQNAFSKSLDYYQKAYQLGDYKSACMLVIMYYEGDSHGRYRDYNRALEIRGRIKEMYDPKVLLGDEKTLYDKTQIAEMKIYAMGGYGIEKNMDVAKMLLNVYNETSTEKIKYKDLETA